MTTVFFSRLQWNNSLFLPSPPLEVGLLKSSYGGLGERCKLPQQGLGWSSSQNRIWCILALKSDIWWQQFQWFSWEPMGQISCMREHIFPDFLLFSRTTLKFPDFSRFSRWVATLSRISSKDVRLTLRRRAWRQAAAGVQWRSAETGFDPRLRTSPELPRDTSLAGPPYVSPPALLTTQHSTLSENITVKLRRSRLFENSKINTNRFLNSFIPYCIRNLQ